MSIHLKWVDFINKVDKVKEGVKNDQKSSKKFIGIKLASIWMGCASIGKKSSSSITLISYPMSFSVMLSSDSLMVTKC